MSYYDSYLTNLDSLIFDTPNETVQTETDIAKELDLWSNAQFTFDVKPGVGIYDDEKTKPVSAPVSTPASATTPAVNSLDSVTYETLVKYLDYELPSRPEVNTLTEQKTKTRTIQPRPLAPALTPALPVRQILMPKPALAPVVEDEKKTVSLKRPAPKETKEEVHPDEDKRRRNTAASARFRVKKKLREQAMEQSVRDMTQKSEQLQNRVNQLEAEIQFLRGLLLDKVKSN